MRARELIIGTNGYTGPATPFLRRRIVPVTSYMIATEELPETVVSSLFPTRRIVTDTNRLLCYYRLSPDSRRILFGGRPLRLTTMLLSRDGARMEWGSREGPVTRPAELGNLLGVEQVEMIARKYGGPAAFFGLHDGTSGAQPAGGS